jgi:hypothetical protein
MMYAAAFLAALLVDTIPVFAPPAWTLLLFLILRFDLRPWPVLALGAAGSTVGRYVLSVYMPELSKKLLNEAEIVNIHFLGERIGRPSWGGFGFVLLYSLTPLSTTALFTAVGIAGVDPTRILPAFFIGKLASDAAMIFTGRYEVLSFQAMLRTGATLQTAMAALLAYVLIAGVLFVDWKTLLERGKLHLRFHVWA